MQTDDASYYRRRALEEQIAGQQATCDAARKSHDQLAAAYRFRAGMASEALAFRVRALRNLFEAELGGLPSA